MKYSKLLILIILILLVDQCLKIYIKTHFYYGQEVALLGSWFRLHFIENEGMAFGMKFGDASIAKLILTLFRLIAVGFGFYYLKVMIKKGFKNATLICAALILAGAFGNLIDSIFYGKLFSESSFCLAQWVPWGTGYANLFHGRVVDMLYFPLVEWTLPSSTPFIGAYTIRFFEPVFNIADASISIGVLTLLFFQKRLLTLPKEVKTD
ncbi:MAG: lipoprotein signal peptidase [Chitinophagia bacterium]|nr:lipoprotein signal peptidase [Chitinophagia bacterium]